MDASDETRWAPLDAEIEAILRRTPRVDLVEVATAREASERQLTALADGAGSDASVPSTPIEVGGVSGLWYAPGEPARARGVLVYAHGGAFVIGNHSRTDRLCRRLAVLGDCNVLSIDYSLAPEHPFPAALDEVSAAVLSVAGGCLGETADPTRIAVGGVSAGAALAAGAALMARDRAGPEIALALLDQPVLDSRLSTPSARAADGAPLLDRAFLTAMWSHYLGPAGGPGWDSPYAAPGLARDLAGYPPTCIVVAQNDPLRDEALEFGHRLALAGVATEVHLYAGTCHGFTQMAVWQADAAIEAQGRALRRALGTAE